jgi:hypothetical protein
LPQIWISPSIFLPIPILFYRNLSFDYSFNFNFFFPIFSDHTAKTIKLKIKQVERSTRCWKMNYNAITTSLSNNTLNFLGGKWKTYMPPPLHYFKVNICPLPLPHFASIFFAKRAMLRVKIYISLSFFRCRVKFYFWIYSFAILSFFLCCKTNQANQYEIKCM